MANRMKGEVDVKIGDKNYVMCYDHSALIELEDQLDMGIVAISSEMSEWKDPKRIRLKWIRALLYAGLRKYHRNLTIDDVTHLMEQGDQSKIMDAIGTAMSAAFGRDDQAIADRPTSGDARNGTGSEPYPSTSPTATMPTASGESPLAN